MMAQMQFDIEAYVQCVLQWTEAHPGLGGWAGALGSIAAIFATWALSRAEYERAKKHENERKNAELDFIKKIIREFASFLKFHTDEALAGSPYAPDFFEVDQTDNRTMLGIRDLAQLPVMQWPSLEAYTCFKDYWLCAQRVIKENPRALLDNRFQGRLIFLNASFEQLERALERARR
jgi:hypothetical protein